MSNRRRTPVLVHARRTTQGAFLLLFLVLFLQTRSRGADTLGYPVKLFLDFDPLLFISTLLSARGVAGTLWLSLTVLALTAVLGRVFCGWVCPLGTLNNLMGVLNRRPAGTPSPAWVRLKYLLLVGLLVSSVFTLQLTGLLDPLSLTVRSFALGLYPAFNKAVNAAADFAYRLDSGGVTAAADAVLAELERTVLAFRQPLFFQGTLMALLFAGVLFLNLVERRFWCRYLCPLGALLGIAAQYSLLDRSVSEGCSDCALCDDGCQGRASSDGEWTRRECLFCFNCQGTCPTGKVSFRFRRKPTPSPVDLGRRRVLASAASGAAAVLLLRISPAGRDGPPNPSLIRPPGALDEPEFLARCVRCGECMKVCITNGLQPSLLEAGLEGIWTPVLVPRTGYCEYACTLCGQVCPTGAITPLAADRKARVKIGLAMIDRGRCLPWAHATPCIVCEELCPTPRKAVWFEPGEALTPSGELVRIKKPRVDLDLCIGCGICEARCPVTGRPAIYVTSQGESRSKKNQLLVG